MDVTYLYLYPDPAPTRSIRMTLLPPQIWPRSVPDPFANPLPKSDPQPDPIPSNNPDSFRRYGRVVSGASGGSVPDPERRTGSSRGSRVDSDGSGRRPPRVMTRLLNLLGVTMHMRQCRSSVKVMRKPRPFTDQCGCSVRESNARQTPKTRR